MRPKLYPAGHVLWRPTERHAFGFVSPAEFDGMLLSGSQMFSAHVPNSYASALLGTIPLEVVPAPAAGAEAVS